MEGGTYRCTWKKEGRSYRLTVKGRPGLFGSGPTFRDARSVLVERILVDLGDGEPALDFDRPLPKEVLPDRYSFPEVLLVSGHDSALAERPQGLFEGGICALCGNPVGRRNGRPACLSSVPSSRSDGAEARHIGSLFSAAFLKLLGKSGRAEPEFREVLAPSKSRRKLYEVVGRPVADLVAVDDLPLSGIKCAKCRRKVYHHMVGYDISAFLALDDLPDPLPPWFLVRDRETVMVCMTGKAWRRIQGRPGTTNVIGQQIGIAPREHVVRNPKLPLFKS